ncbi:MAG: DUF2236 domain-containing protein [Planctomycetes bacterium]|nr:DUF2236 domain-containing protein [Planctomycetota bacterium]
MRRLHRLRQIQALDPERDHQQIVHLCSCYEFPFDFTRALEFALFRTFAVPRIAVLLDRTGEFVRRAQKRYDDTDLIISTLLECGYDSQRGRVALDRMNALHGHFRIDNADFLYVLSTFVFEPIRWIDRFGWRTLCPQERLGLFFFWREVGRRMGIQDLPADGDTFERYNLEYERTHFRPTEAAHRVGTATRDMFASWFPRPLRPLVRPVMHALMDEPLLTAFGFPPPSPLLRQLVNAGLQARARVLRWLPPRRRPYLRTQMWRPTYPRGYRLEHLGPSLRERPA